MIFCDGFNYAGNKTKNNAAFCDCWSFIRLVQFYFSRYDTDRILQIRCRGKFWWSLSHRFYCSNHQVWPEMSFGIEVTFLLQSICTLLLHSRTEPGKLSCPNAKWFILSIKSPAWKASGCESCLTSLPLLTEPYWVLLSIGPSGSFWVLVLMTIPCLT